MGKLTKRGWTSAEADAFYKRSRETHTVRWRANAYRWTGAETGAEETLMTNVPITGGTLTIDSSAPVRRTLQLDVGGGEDLVPQSTDDPLVPFGQFLRVWMTIDKPDGSWFPDLLMGVFPITTYVFERPSMIATVEAGDYSGRVEEFLHLSRWGYQGKTVRGAIEDMVKSALPNADVPVDATAGANNTKVANFVAEAGQGRWESASALAEKKGYECFFDYDGTLVIRPPVTDDYDDIAPGNGPDIGTKASPVAVISEGTEGAGGSLVGLTASLTREGGCNYVRINMAGTVKRPDKKRQKALGDADWSGEVHAEETGGPAKWGDRFGFLPIVESRDLARVQAGEKAAAQQAANRILHRRRGIVRYLDLDMVGGYWIEPDDKVRLVFGGRTEDHYVQAITFDLSRTSACRLRTRQLAVLDPGA